MDLKRKKSKKKGHQRLRPKCTELAKIIDEMDKDG